LTVAVEHKGIDPNYAAEHFRVYVSTSGTAVGDFTPISDEIVATGDWQQFTYNLSTYAGQQGYIAIRHYNVSNQFVLGVDDFEYALDGDWIYINTNAISIDLTNLNFATQYEVEVQADCDEDGVSVWTPSEYFFTSPCAKFSDDFEQDRSWTFANGDRKNKWFRGTATNNGGTHAIYISNNNGNDNDYNRNEKATVYAYKTLTFAGGWYSFSYDWKANGEDGYDFLRVALVPGNVNLAGTENPPNGFSYYSLPDGWIVLDNGRQLRGTTSWRHVERMENVPAGTYKLAFVWRNDGSGGSNTAAAVDNVKILKLSPRPNPTITASANYICPGTPTTLQTETFATYEWSSGATSQSATVSPTTTTQYTVAVTDGDGCAATSGPLTIEVDNLDATIIIAP